MCIRDSYCSLGTFGNLWEYLLFAAGAPLDHYFFKTLSTSETSVVNVFMKLTMQWLGHQGQIRPTPHEQFRLPARLSKQKMWQRRLLWWNIKKEDNPNWRTQWQRQKVAHISTFKQDQTSTCKRWKFKDPWNELPRPLETKVMRSQASSEYSERKLLTKTVCVI